MNKFQWHQFIYQVFYVVRLSSVVVYCSLYGIECQRGVLVSAILLALDALFACRNFSRPV